MTFGRNSRNFNTPDRDVLHVDVPDILAQTVFHPQLWSDFDDQLDFSYPHPHEDVNVVIGVLPAMYSGENDALVGYQLDYTIRDPVDSLTADLGSVRVSGPIRRAARSSVQKQLRRATGQSSKRPTPYTRKSVTKSTADSRQKSGPTTFLDAINVHFQRTVADLGLDNEFRKMNISVEPHSTSLPTLPSQGKELEIDPPLHSTFHGDEEVSAGIFSDDFMFGVPRL